MRHRSTLKQKNKPHKDGHGPKNKFKTNAPQVPGRTPLPEKGQKDRREQSLEARRQKKLDVTKLAKLIGSKKGPPKVVGLLPCSEHADPDAFTGLLNFQPEAEGLLFPSGTLTAGQFSCKIVPMSIPRNFDFLVDVGKVTDILVLVFWRDEPLDEFGRLAIRIIKSIGMPQCIAVVASPDGSPVPRDTLVQYRNMIQADIPDVSRVLSLGSEEDFEQFVRFLSVTTPKPISWKENRPYMLIQHVEVDQARGSVEVSGYLRSARLNVHQVVTIPYVGDYHIEQANGIVSDPEMRHPLVYELGEDQDVLTADIRPPQTVDSMARTGTGILNDFDNMQLYDDEPGDPEELQEGEEAEMEAQRIEVWAREKEELEFPDEFDKYDGGTQLRERLIKYRGLKSFKTSPWNPYEDLPPDYGRIFEYSNFARTSEAVIADQLNGDIDPGQIVKITLAVNGELEPWSRVPPGRPLTLYGLFKHETKMTVLNCSFTNVGEMVMSKSPMLLVCGFRHLWIRPLFSEDTRASKHLYLRDVDHGQSAIASFMAPTVMQSCPCSYFVERDGEMIFTGTGSVKTVDPCRMIIKRIIITGNLYKTLGRTCRVTMMFFNKEDIQYFRTVGLWTKKKRRGNIVKAVGEKGHFKAAFNDIIDSQDTVCMSLYKRVYPKLQNKEGAYCTSPVSF